VWRPELSRFNTVEMKQWEQIVRDRPILRKIPDYQGRPMYTEERLFTYLQQFERDFAGTQTRIIDATEGGALKRGATSMPLAEAIAQHCRSEIDLSPRASSGLALDRLDECLQSLAKRREEASQVEQISRQTLPLLEQIRSAITDPAAVNRLVGQIDPLRARMNELGATYDLILQLTQITELQRFKADRRISAAGFTGAQRQQLQVERDIDNVRGMIEAAQEFGRLISQVLAQLRTGEVFHPNRRAA
jgi:hypothetical protein